MITDVVKRMLHEVPSGSKANAELPCPPEKKSDSDFSRACRMTPNEVKRMLHEVGNYSKTNEASFAVELKIGNPQTS